MTPTEAVMQSPQAEVLMAVFGTAAVCIIVWAVIAWFEGRAIDAAIKEYRKIKERNAVTSAIADLREAEQRKAPRRTPAIVLALVIIAVTLRKGRR